MVGDKMSRVEEARRRIEEEKKKKQIQKGLDIVQKGKNLKINENKNIFDNVKPKQSFAGDKEEIIGNYTKSSSIDNLYNNVINPMNQFNSSLFYNIGKLPAKAIYKTASAAKNVLRGEEHPFQKAQEKANETFSNFEKNVGYDTSNKDSKIQKANRAGQTVGNTLGYVLGSKALGGGALGYGATSGMNAYANTNDIGDIVFSTSKGAVFGKLNSVIGGGTKNVLERVPIMNTAISATSPSTLGSIFHFGANATKNVIAGGVGMYGAGAITGEAENIYNLIRKRDVTKKDWLKPIWSDEALSNAIIGGIIGGVSGTAADLKKAKLQYKNDYKTLIENLNNKNNAMVKALQNGELQTAQNLNQEAIEMIQAFNNMQYMGFRLDENGKNTLLNMWQATAYANAETNYRPKMLGEETLRQPLDISQLQTNTQMPKNNFNNIKNTTNINEKASTIWQNFKNNAQNSTYNSDQTPKNQNSTQNNFKNDDMNVFDTERKYNTSSLPKNEEEVKTNVRNRLNKEIEKDIEIFVENNTDDYQEIASSDVDYEIEDILRKMYTEEEIDYLYDTDLSSEVFNKISDIISNELEKHFYTFNSETEMYEPNTDKLGNSDEIRFKYDKLPSTDFEYKQLDNIRNMIDDLTWDMKKTLPDGIDITVDESRASADATYITVSNENTDETYEIRVGNHFKSGTSGDADEHIRISDFKTISKLKENLKEKIENGLIDVGGENRQNDTINEQKEKHDVDIIKESDYNNYEVERKKEPRNYIYKNITDEDKARVDSDYKLNKSKYIGKNFVHFDDVSYGYNIEDGEVKVTSKFKGSQKFIREVEEAWENGVDKLSNGNTKITESIRRIKRGGDTSNGISRKQSSSRESDRENIGNGRQQRGIDSTKTSENNGNNLKDSKQSSFSLSENNIKSNEEYDTNLSAEEKLDEYEERKKQALKKIAEKAGVEYSFLDANKGETQRNMFFFLKGHGSLKNQFVKENNINLEGITFEEKYNLIDGNPEFEKFINKITDEYFKISKPEITDEELMEIAQDIHGTTDDYSVGAYMTIDGQLLDFDYGGYRDDHRSLSVPGYDMDSFMKAGNIRMQPEGSGFEVAVEPTEAQYERLADYIDNYIDDDINVDIDGTNDGRTYPRGTDAEKIIDDIRYYFRNGEFPQKSQYANFLEEPHIKYGEQTKNETPIKVLKSTDKILKPQVVGQRIWEGFERQGYINLNSKKVESVQDIAELAQIFRNPKYETFRIIYTSGDIIVGQEAVTSYLPNQSKAFVDNNSNKAFYKMTDRMKRLSADGYYMVHNHPSGVARASKEDIKITKTISDEIVGFKGHIVVDHGTYAYISRGLNGNIEWKDEMKVDTKNALYQGSQFETNMPTNRIPWNNIKISSRDDLGSLMHNLKNSTNYSTLILCDTQNKINSIVDIPNNFFNMKQSQIEGYIRNTSKKYGATYAFVGTSSEDTFNKLKQLTNLRDSVLYQDNTEKFGDKKGNAVFAYEKKFAMRTSEETEEDLTEKKIIEIITNELDIDQKENWDLMPNSKKTFGFPTNEQLQVMDNKKISESADTLNLKEVKRPQKEETYKTNLERSSGLIEQKIKAIEEGKIKRDENAKRVSKEDIRKTIENSINQKLFTKHFRKKAYGIYKPNTDTIRLAQRSDFETAIHELGHQIDIKQLDNLSHNADIKVKAELRMLCERSFPGTYKKIRTQLAEGFAEATRNFIIDSKSFATDYPNTAYLIQNELEKSPQLNKLFNTLQEQIHDYINMTPKDRVLSNVSFEGEEQKPKLTKEYIKDKVIEWVWDDTIPLKRLVEKIAKTKNVKVDNLSPSENIAMSLKLAEGLGDATVSSLRNGYEENGVKQTKGFSEILKDFDHNDIEDLVAYMVSEGNLDYIKANKQTGIRESDAQAMLKEYKDTKIDKASKEIRKINNYSLQRLLQSGLITKEQIKSFKNINEHYVPMNRVIDMEGKIGLNAKGLQNGKVIKGRKGSDRMIINPLESTVVNNMRIDRQIANNENLKNLVDTLKQNDLLGDYIDEIPTPMQFKGSATLENFKVALEKQGVDTTELDLEAVYNIFTPKLSDDKNLIMSYMENGKRKYIQFKDKSLYNIVNGLTGQKGLNGIQKFYSYFNGALRWGATAGNIDFSLPNTISDSQTAFLNSDATFIPIVDSIIGVADAVAGNTAEHSKLSKLVEKIAPDYQKRKARLYELYEKSGAKSTTNRSGLKRSNNLDNVLGALALDKKTLLGKDKARPISAIKKATEWAPALSEEATRFRNFEKEVKLYQKQGMRLEDAVKKAGYNAKRVTQDFSQSGKATRVVNSVIPFTSARIGGTYQAYENFAKNPKRYSTRLALLTASSAVIHALLIQALKSRTRKDEEEYKELQDQKLLDNYTFPIGDGKTITIKKIQGPVRAIINLTEMAVDYSMGMIDDKGLDKRLKAIANDVKMDNSYIGKMTDVAGQFGTPILENALNKDFYYGNDLIPENMKYLDNANKYDENTTETAKLIGKVLNYPPIYIDNLIEGYLAGVGTQIMQASDWVINKVTGKKTAKRQASESFITKRFIADDYKNSQSVSEIYDTYDELKNDEAEGRLTEEQKKQLENIEQAKETMSSINKEIKNARSDLSMNSKEKLEKILELQELRTDTARYYLDKELINSENRNTIELYEYYPASDEYTYTPKNSLKVKVKYEEEDKKEYAQLCRKKYKELIVKTKASYSYKKADKEEKEKLLESDLTKARNYAKDIVSKKVYERGK